MSIRGSAPAQGPGGHLHGSTGQDTHAHTKGGGRVRSAPGGRAFLQPRAQKTGEPCLSSRTSPTCWLCPASRSVS